LIWLYLVTLELTRTFTPRHLRALVDLFSQNVSAKVSFEPSRPWRDMGFSRTLPPTFLFLQSSIVKEPTSQTRCRGPIAFGSGPVECRSRGSLGFHKGELFCRQRRAALVVRRI
jgi:hypothetical protein